MNTYNFDSPINRRNTNSMKWDRYPAHVLPLWVADMDFSAPPAILEALQNRISHPVFGYSDSSPDLLETICAWVYRQHGWKISPEQILLMPGVVTGMNWAAKTFRADQQGWLIQTPVYPPFFQVSKNNNLELIQAPLNRSDAGYEIDFDEFECQIKNGAGIFALCNPHNPVGRVYTQTELEQMGEICLRHQVLICSDEIHCDLTYSDHCHIAMASLSNELANHTITLMAASKTFNIPGLHFSFAIVPNPDLRNRMEAARAGVIGHPSFLANAAAMAAFTQCDDWLQQLLIYLEANRNYLMEFLRENLPEIECFQPEGTYLAWLDCRVLNLKPDPYTFLLEKAGVALNDGQKFGINGKGFVRLNFGCPRETLATALEKISMAINQVE
jgi:cystathionine beta-lyase